MKRRSRQSELLCELGVNTDAPGFYDDPRFVEAERENPFLLEEYSGFIRAKSFTVEYMDRARRIIKAASQFLFDRLAEEGLRGTCIDASMVLSRFLERQGVWNYAANGALTIFFDCSTGLDPTYFSPIMMPGNKAKAGHVWLYAPPFEIVDVTVSRQPYRQGQERFLPDYVLAKKVSRCSFDAADLMEPEAVAHFAHMNSRLPTLEDVETISPGILERIRRFGPVEAKHGQTRLRYLTPAVSAPLEPLEEYRNLRLGGKYPAELYEEFVAQLNGGEVPQS